RWPSRPEALGLRAEPLDAAQLDVLVAAHDVGQLGERQRELGVTRAQRVDHQPAVLADQRALDAAHARPAEDVERRAAQAGRRAYASRTARSTCATDITSSAEARA